MNTGSLFEQTVGLALLAAIYPPGMLLAALYLASERPGRTTFAYVAGGLVMVTLVGVAALFAIRAGGLSHLHQHQTRYGLRLGLGVLALIAAPVIFLRKRRSADGKQAAEQVADRAAEPTADRKKPKKPKKPSLIERLSARPSSWTAFAVGAVMFGPSVTFIAAVQVVATAKAGIGETVAAMVMIIVLTVAFGWLPLVAYLVAPERTVRVLHTFEHWLGRHGRTVLAVAIGVVGLILLIQGIVGLT